MFGMYVLHEHRGCDYDGLVIASFRILYSSMPCKHSPMVLRSCFSNDSKFMFIHDEFVRTRGILETSSRQAIFLSWSWYHVHPYIMKRNLICSIFQIPGYKTDIFVLMTNGNYRADLQLSLQKILSSTLLNMKKSVTCALDICMRSKL